MIWQGEGKRALPLVVAACVSLLVLHPAGGTGPAPSVGALRADQADLAAKSRAAVLDLYSLDERLATALRRLGRLQAAEQRLAAQRTVLVQELRLARVDARLSQNRLALRLRFIYEHGSTSSLDVVMGAKSLEDAMTQLDDYNRVASANAFVLLQVTAAHRHLVVLQRTIGARAQSLAATTTAATRTVAELQSLRSSRAAYVSELSSKRALDVNRIAALTAEAEAAVVKSQTLTATAQPTAVVESAPVPVVASGAAVVATAGASSMTVDATAYSLPGHTSSGLPVGWGIAAVDPSVIPLGTRFVVPGYGVAVAADTGSAIIGARIDFWFPTLAQADAWGRRTVTISLT